MLDIGKVNGRIYTKHDQPILGARSGVLCHIPEAVHTHKVSQGHRNGIAEDLGEEASDSASNALKAESQPLEKCGIQLQT